jgi:hypothetical protein
VIAPPGGLIDTLAALWECKIDELKTEENTPGAMRANEKKNRASRGKEWIRKRRQDHEKSVSWRWYPLASNTRDGCETSHAGDLAFLG